MSFIISYKPLFDIAVVEDSTGERLAGFGLDPSATCARTLADHQLVHRERQSGCQVFYATNPEATAPVLGPITARTRFTFALRTNDRSLFERYEPDLTTGAPQLYFDNLDVAGAIDPETTLAASGIVATDDAAKIHARILRVRTDMTGADPPTEIRVLDRFDGSLVKHVAIAARDAAEVSTEVDLREFPAGAYALQTDAPGSTPMTIYVDDEVKRVAPLGVVDFYQETGQDTAAVDGNSYTIRFKKR